MKPPYSLTQTILNVCVDIERILGRCEGFRLSKPEPQLRRKNRIRSIQGSLSIEGNSLSTDQITAIFENRRVLGPRKDILEIQNAIRAYEEAVGYDAFSEKSFLKAHKILMNGLIPNAGKWRSSGIGVLKGNQVVHMAPPARQIPQLMGELFAYLRSEKKSNLLVPSAVVHYEIEFIHPFSDGNGRMGRLWQHTMLMKHHPLFEYIPFESVIREYQQEYYQVLHACDQKGDSTLFVEFCLQKIRKSLETAFEEFHPEPLTTESRLRIAKDHFQKRAFSRKDYMSFFKTLSTATASRDLSHGVDRKILKKEGEKALTQYHYS